MENIYNIDETGVAIGAVQRSYILVNKELKTRYSSPAWLTGAEKHAEIYLYS